MDSIRFTSTRAAVVCMAALLSALPASALYKVIGPDGKVSFTDKPPLTPENKVQQINPGSRGAPAPADASLPFELRQAMQRHPVTVYTTTNCGSCDSARALLKQRGVPFSEKTITTNADNEALRQLTGSGDLPAVTIGSKTLLGLQREEWTSYLDAAGYPKESRLPRTYQYGSATPLAPAAAAPAPAPAPTPEPGTLPAAPAPGGFRF
jgi:glutaredoxin